jgi:hypothetical protein
MLLAIPLGSQPRPTWEATKWSLLCLWRFCGTAEWLSWGLILSSLLKRLFNVTIFSECIYVFVCSRAFVLTRMDHFRSRCTRGVSGRWAAEC